MRPSGACRDLSMPLQPCRHCTSVRAHTQCIIGFGFNNDGLRTSSIPTFPTCLTPVETSKAAPACLEPVLRICFVGPGHDCFVWYRASMCMAILHKTSALQHFVCTAALYRSTALCGLAWCKQCKQHQRAQREGRVYSSKCTDKWQHHQVHARVLPVVRLTCFQHPATQLRLQR